MTSCTKCILIRFENSCFNEIPAFAGILAFGKRQNNKLEKQNRISIKRESPYFDRQDAT